MNIDRNAIIQFVKYAIVGCFNTLITLGVIYVCKSHLGVNDYVSNALGYAAGLINSFIWNKRWVFRSRGGARREMALFLIGFAVCYALQFLVVWLLNQSAFGDTLYDLGFFVISGYGIATLAGNVVYTLANFAYNRLVTFHTASSEA